MKVYVSTYVYVAIYDYNVCAMCACMLCMLVFYIVISICIYSLALPLMVSVLFPPLTSVEQYS